MWPLGEERERKSFRCSPQARALRVGKVGAERARNATQRNATQREPFEREHFISARPASEFRLFKVAAAAAQAKGQAIISGPRVLFITALAMGAPECRRRVPLVALLARDARPAQSESRAREECWTGVAQLLPPSSSRNRHTC